MTELRNALSDDATVLTQFIMRQCGTPERHCFRSWSGNTVAASIAEQRGSLESGALLFSLAFEGDQLVGALGCDLERSNERIWLKGPHIESRDEAVATELAERLWQHLVERVPFSPTERVAYLNQKNLFARGFWKRHGLERERDTFVFRWDVDVVSIAPVALRLHCLEPAHAASFDELLRSLLPKPQFSAEALLKKATDACLATLDGDGAVCGFVVFGLESKGQGAVRYLGVKREMRGQGLAHQLLLGAMHALAKRKASRVLLSVDETNLDARSLYESAGFRLERACVSLHG